jgi:hypothetical protein
MTLHRISFEDGCLECYIESFNGKLGDELQNREIVTRFMEARYID